MNGRKFFFFDIDGTLTTPLTNDYPDSTREAIKELQDNGHFVAIATGRMQADAWEVAKALGMKPKPLAWGETYTALKEGIVEGEGNTFSFLLDAEHEDILKYAFASQHNYSMQILSANKKWWEELDPQVRSIIGEAAAEALKYQREVLAPQSEEEAVKRFMADGLEVSKPSEAELEELKRKTRPVWNLFSDTLSQELIDLVVATQQ